MTIKSMTGFSRADGTAGSLSWHWEVRSVNGRGIDIRLRMPPGFENLEPRVRDIVSKSVARGSVSVTLSVKRTSGQTHIRLNEAALQQVMEALERLKQLAPVAPTSADVLLGIKGVLEVAEAEETEADAAARTEAMLKDLERALDDLVQVRAEEGARLTVIVLDQLAAVERLVEAIARSPARSPEAIKQRLKDQISRLMETSTFDEARLHQEAVLLATRADTEEELKRLGAHISAARDLLQSDKPAGRRLDFLAQEFNREANTLCSKANDVDTTRAGLEMKAIIDQMREQVQNIE